MILSASKDAYTTKICASKDVYTTQLLDRFKGPPGCFKASWRSLEDYLTSSY